MIVYDPNKNTLNIRKHHVDFREAAKLFTDPNRIIYYDEKHSNINEKRWICIGRANKRILIVSFTKRNSSIRLISARRASKRIKRLYSNK